MQTAQYEQWLRDTREFWEVDSLFDAKYRRICAGEEFQASEDEEQLCRLWEDETQRAIEWITDGVPLSVNWDCLEIGCGLGRLMKPLAQKTHSVTGVDISERMVNYSQEYLSDTPNARTVQNDGSSLSMIEDGSIDFVYSHLAFQHLTLYEIVDKYLAEIARVLKPGGYLRVQTMQEAPAPLIEHLKDMIRPLLGKEKYRSARCFQWKKGKEVKFGGVTFRPHEWQHMLDVHGLKTIKTQLGCGHDFWMWTTSVKQ